MSDVNMKDNHLRGLSLNHGTKFIQNECATKVGSWPSSNIRWRYWIVCAACTRSPRTSIHTASSQLQITRSTIHSFEQSLRLYACKVHLLLTLKPEDEPRWKEFAVSVLDKLDSDPGFLERICFSNESTFHVNGMQTTTFWEFRAQRTLTKPMN